VIRLKELLSESNSWDRKFGEPLPTLQDVTNKHNNITEDDCGCNGTSSCACESVNEGPDEKIKANKELQRVMKAESKLRERMIKLEQIYLQDARPENQKLAKEIKESYKKHVTTFMKDVIKLTKKVK